MISYASLAGSTVQVQPPTGSAITAQEISAQVLGPFRMHRSDSSTIVVTYEFVPPAGNWYAAPPHLHGRACGSPREKTCPAAGATPEAARIFQASVPPHARRLAGPGERSGTRASAVSNSRSPDSQRLRRSREHCQD